MPGGGFDSNEPDMPSLPVLSSLSRAHPTGVDGIPQESDPSSFTQVSSSFLYLSAYNPMLPQPLSRQERFEALKANLLEVYKLIDS